MPRLSDISCLGWFVAAQEKQNYGKAFFPEINPVPMAKHNAGFLHAFTNGFVITEVAHFKAENPRLNASLDPYIKAVKPFAEVAYAIG